MQPHKYQAKLEISLFTSTGYFDGDGSVDAALLFYRKNHTALK